jgi:hypothetical protein
LSQEQGTVQLNSAIYAGKNGEIVVQDVVRTGLQQPMTTMSGRLVASLANKTVSTNKDQRLMATFATLRGAPTAQTAVVKAVAASDGARTKLLEGFEALEKALEYPLGDPAGDQLLAQARQALDEAVKQDLSNPLAELLLANCCYNQYQSALRADQTEEAEAHRGQFEGALRKAYLFRDESSDFAYLKQEVEADYALLIEKDYAEAIRIYEQLANGIEDTPLHTAVRAHWMLAGIYAGDWGIAQDAAELVDGSKSRAHLIQILAHWENSNEAKFIRKNIRWDDETGRSDFEFFPQTEQPRAETVDT